MKRETLKLAERAAVVIIGAVIALSLLAGLAFGSANGLQITESSYEADFRLATDIVVNVTAGTKNRPDIVSTEVVRFDHINGGVQAILKIEYVSGPFFEWLTRIELLHEDGEVLCQAKLRGRNSGVTWGHPVPIEHRQHFSFGQVKNLSGAKRFRISIGEVKRKPGRQQLRKEAKQKYNSFYGRVLYEDATPAIAKPWSSAATQITIRPYPEDSRYHLNWGIRKSDGLFSIYLPDEVLESLSSGNRQISIYCPSNDDEGGRIFKEVGVFPYDMLVPEMSQARVLEIRRPEEVQGTNTFYASRWDSHEDYQRRLLKLHQDKYVADTQEMAENIEWGLSQNGLRCKLVPASQSISKGDPLFFLIHLQNVSKNTISIDSHFRQHINFYLNGRATGQEVYLHEPLSFEQSSGVSDYLAIKPDETVTGALPVGNLATFDFAILGDGAGCSVGIDNTGNPGNYRIYAIYGEHRSRNHDGWWKGKVTSNEIVIKVLRRDRDVYEDEFALDRDIRLILYTGSQNNPYIIKGNSIRFEKVGINTYATLKICFRTVPPCEWQVGLEIVTAGGKVLIKKKAVENNRGKARMAVP